MGIVTGILIAASIGTSIASAAMKAKAAKDAAKIQTEGAKVAEKRAAQAFDPYMSVGGGAAWTLGELMGIKPGMMPKNMPGSNMGPDIAGPRPNSRIAVNQPGAPPPVAPTPQPTIASIAAQTPTEGSPTIAQQRTQSGYVTNTGDVV